MLRNIWSLYISEGYKKKDPAGNGVFQESDKIRERCVLCILSDSLVFNTTKKGI